MSYKMRRRAVLARLESAYGTDPTVDPASPYHPVLCRSVSVTPLAGENIERELIRPYYGNGEVLAGEKFVELELQVEITGSAGLVGLGYAPAWNNLIRACGFAETTIEDDPPPTRRIVYNPITGGEESLTCYIHRDGILHKFHGGRGTVSMQLDVNQVPYFTFRFNGLYAPVTETAIPSSTNLSLWVPPRPVATRYTDPIDVHGASGIAFSQLSIDMAIDVVRHAVVGHDTSVEIVDRKPSGTMVIEEPALADFDVYAAALAAVNGTFEVTHAGPKGSVGSVTISAPACALGSPTEQDLNGVQMLSVPLTFNPVSGNDELLITVPIPDAS